MNQTLRYGRISASAVLLGILFIAAALCFSVTPARGQATSTTTVVGQITDQSGAVVPGAEVTLLDVDTQTKRTTISNESRPVHFRQRAARELQADGQHNGLCHV